MRHSDSLFSADRFLSSAALERATMKDCVVGYCYLVVNSCFKAVCMAFSALRALADAAPAPARPPNSRQRSTHRPAELRDTSRKAKRTAFGIKTTSALHEFTSCHDNNNNFITYCWVLLASSILISSDFKVLQPNEKFQVASTYLAVFFCFVRCFHFVCRVEVSVEAVCCPRSGHFQTFQTRRNHNMGKLRRRILNGLAPCPSADRWKCMRVFRAIDKSDVNVFKMELFRQINLRVHS